MDAYLNAYKLGLKSIAIYRNGSKRTQPLTVVRDDKKIKQKTLLRKKLPDERRAITHRFMIGPHKGYITVGLYEDGSPGELFITMAKEGSTLSGMMDAFATSISIALQYGVPLKTLINKFVHMRFEPSGFTTNPNIRIAKSIVDYIFRWFAMKFLKPEELQTLGLNNIEIVEHGEVKDVKENGIKDIAESKQDDDTTPDKLLSTFKNQDDAIICPECGAIMVRNGSCYKCLNCGATSGCS